MIMKTENNEISFAGLNKLYKYSFWDGILWDEDNRVEMDIKTLSSKMVALIKANMDQDDMEGFDKALVENGFVIVK